MNEVLLRVEEATRQLRGVRGFPTTGCQEAREETRTASLFAMGPRSQQKCSTPSESIQASVGSALADFLLFPGAAGLPGPADHHDAARGPALAGAFAPPVDWAMQTLVG